MNGLTIFKGSWKVVRDFVSEGLVESIKGILTGGSVGAILNSWQGFLIGILTGSILGAFLGSSLAKVFEWVLEHLHLMLNLRKIEYDLLLEDVPPETASVLEANFLLIRYGRDEVIQLTVRSKQDILATRLRNKVHKVESVYDKETSKLILKFRMKRHLTFGVQFKLFFSGASYEELKPILEKSSFIKEFNPGGGDDSRIWTLIQNKTKVTELKKNKGFSIAEVKSIEGIPNNFIYPK